MTFLALLADDAMNWPEALLFVAFLVFLGWIMR